MHLNDLPAELAQFVDDALASGKYQSVEDLVGKALQVLQQQNEARGTPQPSNATEAHIPLVPLMTISRRWLTRSAPESSDAPGS